MSCRATTGLRASRKSGETISCDGSGRRSLSGRERGPSRWTAPRANKLRTAAAH